MRISDLPVIIIGKRLQSHWFCKVLIVGVYMAVQIRAIKNKPYRTSRVELQGFFWPPML